MSKTKFLKNLEEISDEFVNESWASNLHNEAEDIFKEYDDEIEELNDKVNELDEENDGYYQQVQEIESKLKGKEEFDTHGTPYDNLRGKMVFEKLFSNLEYIPINELEQLVEKHAVL